MHRFAYAIITNRGRALDVLFSRLKSAMDPNKQGWDEEESIKKVSLVCHLRSKTTRDNNFNSLLDDLVPQHDRVIQGLWLLDWWRLDPMCHWNFARGFTSAIGCKISLSPEQSFSYADSGEKTTHFVFLELCARPEYVQQLRDEIGGESTLDCRTISKLPILDSFIKEATRVNAPDKCEYLVRHWCSRHIDTKDVEVNIRRKAIHPFTFSKGGPHLAVGDIACVSAWDIMHNEEKYPMPHEFDGHRFINDPFATSKHLRLHDGDMRGTTFADASKDFPIWGYGSKVW